ncbi:hypothetical protein [Kitasatospora camelliae]|uniref:Uncharacterized protein n=1 Tax=Kitasatospora camelliae TaxID=3156397 RepID=A0AAU8K7M4_9ACTN
MAVDQGGGFHHVAGHGRVRGSEGAGRLVGPHVEVGAEEVHHSRLGQREQLVETEGGRPGGEEVEEPRPPAVQVLADRAGGEPAGGGHPGQLAEQREQCQEGAQIGAVCGVGTPFHVAGDVVAQVLLELLRRVEGDARKRSVQGLEVQSVARVGNGGGDRLARPGRPHVVRRREPALGAVGG